MTAPHPRPPAPGAATPPTVRVFDPPMCCSTGVCGPDPDPELARFAADLRWLEERGVRVERWNLSREPDAFVRAPAVADALRRSGVAALPLVLVGLRLLRIGGYPSRAELAQELALPATEGERGPSFAAAPCCAPGAGCCG